VRSLVEITEPSEIVPVPTPPRSLYVPFEDPDCATRTFANAPIWSSTPNASRTRAAGTTPALFVTRQ